MTAPAPAAAPASQTLSRGIRVLEELADVREPLSIDDLARRLTVHRSVVYRLLRTLEDHGLVTRDSAGRAQLGTRLAALASSVAHDLQAEALPELTAVANDLGMTCFLTVLDRDECITVASIEPRHAVAAVTQRPGSRHSIAVGAPSKAILATLGEATWPTPPNDHLRAEVAITAARGYATSHDEVIPTVQSIAVPLRLPAGQRPAAIAVVYVDAAADPVVIAARLQRAADAIGTA